MFRTKKVTYAKNLLFLMHHVYLKLCFQCHQKRSECC
jgi:hypothetical protein